MGRPKQPDNDRTLRVINSPHEIAAVIKEELAAAGSGPLPELTVMTSSSALVHQLRASSGGLSGVAFLFPLEVASLVLLANGQYPGAVADPYLASLTEALISSPVLEGRLRYFKIEQLRTGAGYAEALATTISELSHAALTPAALRQAASSDPATASRLKDIAAVWEDLESQASSHGFTTYSKVLDRASAILSDDPRLFPLRGRTVAFIDEQTTTTLLHFLAAIPRLTAVYFRAFPERRKLKARLDHAISVLNLTAHPPATGGPSPSLSTRFNELDILKKRLFSALGEAVEAAPRRSPASPTDPALASLPETSPGPDGTVHLEEHSGVEEELQSAVDWVSRQVLEHNVPLERIAVLLPEIDPYAFMLVERLGSLPFDGSLPFAAPLPVYVASGIPATTRADGSRLLALLDTLEEHLSADSISRFLPYLRLSENRHLTFAESLELAYSCGTLGGLAGRPDAAREWTSSIKKRLEALASAIADQKSSASDPDEPEASHHARVLEANERLFANLQAVLPAITELVKLHDLIHGGAPLGSCWDAFERFASTRVLLPPAIPPVLPLLKKEIGPLCSLSEAGSDRTPSAAFCLSGLPALRTIRKTLGSIRLPVGRFGEPRIYIGSLAGAAGLTFDAVRVMGLCEGAWPSHPPVDPILPDVDRSHLETGDAVPEAIPRRDDRPLQQLCSFYRVIQGVRSRLVLSFARQSADGTIKEPSSIYLEAATALRRPVGGKLAPPVPSIKDLRLGYFAPAREAELNPPALGEFTVCRAIAGRAASPKALILPASWRTSAASSPTDLSRMRDLILLDRSAGVGPQDGIFPRDWPLPRLPGLTEDVPLSASRVSSFLGCPHRFLLDTILHWEEPPSAPSTREIGQPSYGSLLHQVAESFFSENGPEFTSSRRTEAKWNQWKKIAGTVIDREFKLFLEEYPLLSGRVHKQQRQRLFRDFVRLLEFEWHNRPDLKFRAAEFRCGFPDPICLDLAGRRLFVRGVIDRLDELDGRLFIRDFKSGKGRPREKDEAGPSPVLDSQLAVYALIMNALHKKEPKLWPEVGGVAYFYPDPSGAIERPYIADLDDLLEKGRDWLAALADLVEARQFPRTDDGDDCQYCAFVPVCGEQAKGAAGDKLKNAGPLVKRFLALKQQEAEEDEEIDG
ncbi:MAG: PD-(D/E)XK nuclease family protein [Candidatus Aminicenantales bacterium]